MQTKILGAVMITAALALAGCSGSTSSSSSSGSTGTTSSHTTGTNSSAANTTGSNGTSSTTSQTNTTGSNGSTATTANNSSSTGGTTAANSTGSTGTTSSNGSTGGTTGTCTLQCGNGTQCHADLVDTQGNAVPQVCACSPAQFDSSGNITVPDTCAANQDGNIVCDDFTLTCRGPEEYEKPNTVGVYPDGGGNSPCAFDPANGIAFVDVRFCANTIDANGNCLPFADGGSAEDPLCVGLCSQNSECGSAQLCRTDSPFYCAFDDGGVAMLADGGIDANCATNGGTAVGFCDLNVCGTNQLTDGGTLNSDYFAACDAHGVGDGTCLPELRGAGLCHVVNDAGFGAACNPNAFNQNTDQGCAADSLCLFSSDLNVGTAPGTTGVCLPMCNSNATAGQPYDVTCPTIGSTTTHCNGFQGDTLPGNLNPGICF
ncbi:MAG: hypothetical protein JST54_07435 [Deltaproteobacteria bacterium]|nr:hypothetical protein [Deltaproteobacteria bacterium]